MALPLLILALVAATIGLVVTWRTWAAERTGRRRAERARQRIERQHNALMTAAPVGIFQTDAEGATFYVNDRWCAITGLSADEAYGDGWTRGVHPAERQRVHAAWRQGVARNRTAAAGDPGRWDFEQARYRFLRPDGEIAWVIGQVAAIRGDDGAVTGYIGTTTDVTALEHAEVARLRLEAQVRQMRKLDSLQELAGGVAHEFNNLLSGILGSVGLAAAEQPENAPLRAHLGQIEDAALRAAELCQQLLLYAGETQPSTEATDLNQVVTSSSHLLETAAFRHATIDYRLGDEVPTVDVDPAQIRQAVFQLVAHAARRSDGPGHRVVIATGAETCNARRLRHSYLHQRLPAGRYVTFAVSDSGPSLDEHSLETLFDPFATARREDRGLGLAAVPGIVRSHRGAIEVVSEPAAGTTVRLLFPVAKRPAPALAATSAEQAHPAHREGAILVVDDEEVIRRVACSVLEKAGYQVLAAADGREALDVFERRPDEIACVLLDLIMPRMDGEEAFTRLRDLRPDLPIVLSSGYSEKQATRRFTEREPTAFLAKPYRTAALVETIRSAVGHSAS